MTVKYINVMIGPKQANGSYGSTHKGTTTAQASDFSIAYDDAVIVNMNQLRAAVAQALAIAEGSSFPKG